MIIRNDFSRVNGRPAFDIIVAVFEVKNTRAGMSKLFEDIKEATIEYGRQKEIFKDHIVLKACERSVRYSYGSHGHGYREIVLHEC